jgi:hypothetical protein
MANLARHPSLRFSVFELANELNLETHVLDGNFNPIIEEDESEVSSYQISLHIDNLAPLTVRPRQSPNPVRHRQRRTQSSDELSDSPYPLTPPSSNDVRFN